MKALSDYRVFYGEVPLPVFVQCFFSVWKILNGKLDAISFDYWFRHAFNERQIDVELCF
jgi:hypothetical protein